MKSETAVQPQAGTSNPGTGLAIGAALGVAVGAIYGDLALMLALGTALGSVVDVASHVSHKRPKA